MQKTNYNGKEWKKKRLHVNKQLRDGRLEYWTYGRGNITVCIARGYGVCLRGIALRSPGDNHCNVVGDFYAKIRVLKACKHMNCGEPITRQEVIGILSKEERKLLVAVSENQASSRFRLKKAFDVKLTPHEKQLFDVGRVT